MGYTYFKYKSLHKYTIMARCQDGVEVKSTIDLVLVKKYAVLCARCKGSERNRMGMDGARRIRSEKLKEHQYREGHARFLEKNRTEWKGESYIEHMWDQVKRAMIESAREAHTQS